MAHRRIPLSISNKDNYVILGADGRWAADYGFLPHTDEDNAALAVEIVRAVNNHDALLETLRSARARLALAFGPDRDPRDDATVREIDAAIERATS